jgi:hypothetical protein
MGLYVTATTQVRDLVSKDEVLMTEMDQRIRRVEFGDVRYFGDGSCEVDAKMTIDEVVRLLTRIHELKQEANGWTRHAFDEVIERAQRQTIEVTGYGCVEDEPRGAAVATDSMHSGDMQRLPDIYRERSARARLMAQRAAEIDAYRRLAERVHGLHITASTTVRDYVTEYDQINAAVQQNLRGARVRSTAYGADGVVSVTMELTVTELMSTTRRIVDETKVDGHTSHEATERTEQESQRKVIVVTGRGVMPAQTR